MSAQPNPANDRGVAALQAALTRAQVELAQARGEIERLTDGFQARAGRWVVACFGDLVACDELERMDRAVEEFYEGLQARDYPRERLAALERYTWSRPVGEISQEFGGIMMTLAAWAQAIGIDMHASGETELARVWTKVDQIRAKQAAKPVGSALPVAVSARPPCAPSTGAGWVIKNGADTLFRKWGGWGAEWTDDPTQALYFARRTDAEAFCAEDEDAWRVVELPLSGAMTHRHVKRGTVYQVLGHAELQQASQFGPSEGDTLTIYRAQDGKMWARALSEFDDGRFERLTPDGATT